MASELRFDGPPKSPLFQAVSSPGCFQDTYSSPDRVCCNSGYACDPLPCLPNFRCLGTLTTSTS